MKIKPSGWGLIQSIHREGSLGCSVCAGLCLTLWDSMDYSLPGFFVHEFIQARVLEWTAVPHSRGSSWPRDWTHVSCIGRQIFATTTTWDVAHRAKRLREDTAGWQAPGNQGQRPQEKPNVKAQTSILQN